MSLHGIRMQYVIIKYWILNILGGKTTHIGQLMQNKVCFTKHQTVSINQSINQSIVYSNVTVMNFVFLGDGVCSRQKQAKNRENHTKYAELRINMYQTVSMGRNKSGQGDWG